ncbi:protein Aster-B-like isoform X3 [Periplaneta americana]|uniref:protein Aster-B-like isoform X3 n=1 Tax=Periplaneta americana TaxID=6978 RepID=UPI0037E8CC7B
MNDCEVQYTTAGLMRKSVENLLISSHDVIGSSISPSLTFGAMTLPTITNQHIANTLDLRSPSPSASPQSSPRPSPRQHHKRDHSKGDISVGSFKDSSPLDKSDILEDSVSRSSDSSHIPEVTRSLSHEGSASKDRTKESSRGSDRTKKKSSWYNVLYPTYKSRSEDFKRIFKDVPPEERLIVDYSCALQKDILVHGRLYVSQNYLCFYANIFRWETSVSLRWKDVTAITKEKTALVIPNAILVCTEGEKLFFTSFGARDKTYLMLFRVWQNALMDQQMSMQEMWQWVHTCYGDELGLTSDDEDYIPPVAEDDKLSTLSVRLSVDSFSEQESCSVTESSHMEMTNTEERQNELPPSALTAGLSVHSTSYTGSTVHSTVRRESAAIHERSSLQVPVSETLPTDMSDTTESEAEKHATLGSKPVVCTSSHEGRKIIRATIPIHIDLLFTMLFTNSKFYLDFHSVRRTSDISHTPWQQDSQTGIKQRVVNLTMPLNQSVGPKSTQVTETQVMLPCSKPGELYAIDTESVNAGIPYADSFYVTTHYCLSRESDTESCLAVYAQIKYKKSVWGLVKSFIEKNTWSGLEDFYVSLQRALLEEGSHLPVAKKKTRRRRRLLPVVSGGSEEPKRRISRPIPRFPLPELRSPADTLSWIVLAILLFLVLLNALLYYKLWTLEEWAQDSSQSFSVMDLQVLRHPPKSHDEWLHLLQQQEALHNVEMQKWQKVLQAAVQLLRQKNHSVNYK